ncbi:2,3-bisphosphoglycerate-dependent phosphoglycerate mutase [Frankliniella fusca]|uniref:2,3-bisphosphoglycerate-dependent phosphoglycerate mutase n=1 Tax=Frankliniella fusca TaxID=407009 RepID=A0AAE1HK89_9NEOP|nr:2,3-bisphosphoglycerate-dependent phosphoglycerate mutase [Frankliniella fusca]
MRNTKNFINPELTCAERQQMYFCYSSLEPILENSFEEIDPINLSPDSYSGELSAFLRDQNLTGWSASKTVIANHGISYKCGDVLVLGRNGPSLAVAILKVLASKDNQLKFILETTSALFIPAHGCYEIDIDSTGILIQLSPESFKYPVPQPAYSKGKKMLISLKHTILEDE